MKNEGRPELASELAESFCRTDQEAAKHFARYLMRFVTVIGIFYPEPIEVLAYGYISPPLCPPKEVIRYFLYTPGKGTFCAPPFQLL